MGKSYKKTIKKVFSKVTGLFLLLFSIGSFSFNKELIDSISEGSLEAVIKTINQLDSKYVKNILNDPESPALLAALTRNKKKR